MWPKSDRMVAAVLRNERRDIHRISVAWCGVPSATRFRNRVRRVGGSTFVMYDDYSIQRTTLAGYVRT